jgi:hypothetical protein
MLPWSTCNNWWNLPSCRTLGDMHNYTALAKASCHASSSTINASITECLQNATENLAQYTSPVKEFWEYVLQKTVI